MPDTERRSNAKVSPPPPLQRKRGASEWKLWKQMWLNYVVVARLQNEEPAYMRALFLHTLGPDGLEIYNGLELDEHVSVDNIIKSLDTYFIGETNETYERYVFNKRDQQEGEPIEVYVNTLRQLVKTCNFTADMAPSLIRDRIILGIRSQTTREALLQTPKLTLQTCIEKCRAAETTNQQLKAMSDTGLAHSVKKTSDSTKRERVGGERKCYFCGGKHVFKKEECPAWGKECSTCGKKNHLPKVCQSKGRGKQKKIHRVEEQEESDASDEYVLAVGNTDKKIITAKMIVGDKKIICQVDSGASVNVISAKHVNESKIKPTSSVLHVYNGNSIKTVGKANLEIRNPKTKETVNADFMVVEDQLMTLLGKETSEVMKLITVHYERMNIAAVKDSKSILSAFSDVFEKEIGQMPGEAHLEVDESIKPTIAPSCRVPLALKSKVKEELNRLTDAGVITPVEEPTSWCSRLLVATKKSGALRICIDPRPLNRALKREHHTLPTLEDVLPLLSKGRIFSKLDLRNAFWHVCLDEESSKLTTFQTPSGRYRWLRLPFGTSVSSELFQKRLEQTLEDLVGVIGVTDDIIVYGEGDNDEEAQHDHDANLIKLLERCRQAGLALNKEKAELNKTEISFLGHIISSEGLKIDPTKVEAVLQMPKPTDVEGVRRLCGFVNYLAKFLPRLADVLLPIRQLTQNNVPWTWTQTHDEAFETVKRLVSEAPVLAYFDNRETVTIQCDASQSGLGAVMTQKGRPIAYASRALTDTETRYAQIEKEMLAIVFSLERFH